MAFVPVNFGKTDYAIHFDRRDTFSFQPVLAAEARNKQRVFADAAPSGDGFYVDDVANNFHEISLSQKLAGRNTLRSNACHQRTGFNFQATHQRIRRHRQHAALSRGNDLHNSLPKPRQLTLANPANPRKRIFVFRSRPRYFS